MGDKNHTVTYTYRLASSDAKDAWLIRWEYYRRPPRPDYGYPLGHLHVNATLIDSETERRLATPVAAMHIPTARVPFEFILWHLLAEWGVGSKTAEWQDVLRESLAGFEQRRTAPLRLPD